MGYDKPCYHTVFTLFIRVKQSPLLSKNDTIQHQFCHTTLESSHHIERNQIACNFLAAVTLAIQVWFVKGMDISMITVDYCIPYSKLCVIFNYRNIIYIDIVFRTHIFDREGRRAKTCKRKSGVISDFQQPSRGAQGVHAYHRTNEEKILPHRRAGLPDDDIM